MRYVYLYETINHKKDRKRGIQRLTQTAWRHTNKEIFIKANRFEITMYRFRTKKEYRKNLDEAFEYLKQSPMINFSEYERLHFKNKRSAHFVYDRILISGLIELLPGYGNWKHYFCLSIEGKVKLGNQKYSTYKLKRDFEKWWYKNYGWVFTAITIILTAIGVYYKMFVEKPC